MTEDAHIKKWEIDGLAIRAVCLDNVPVKPDYDSDETETWEERKLWFLFAGLPDRDFWLSFAVSDTLVEEPRSSLENSNIEELKRLVVLLGEPWEDIEPDVKATAVMQREEVKEVSHDLRTSLMSESVERVIRRREMVDWKREELWWLNEFGLRLGLN